MAGILTKMLGWLKGFLKSMPSPMSGYNIEDVKVNSKNNTCSALFTFNGETKLTDERNGEELTDIKGNAIKLSVLISAINVNTALDPLLKGMNKMSADLDKSADLLNVLLGKDRQDNEFHEKSGKGLLGANPEDIDKFFYTPCGSYNGRSWSWGEIATDYLKYSLECQAEGKDYGAIENQTLTNCQNLCSEYLMKVDIIQNLDEVQVDPLRLCFPILVTLHGKLCDYYQNAYNKNVEGKSTAEKEAEAKQQQESQTEEQPQEGTQTETQEEGNNMNPQNTESSKRILVKLQKITASEDIDLLGLQSNYTPTETLYDLEDIIYQADFQEALTGDPQTFDIAVDDDGYDISTCEDGECEFDPMISIRDVFIQVNSFKNTLHLIHWMSIGVDMMKIHEMAQTMYEELGEELDTLGELLVEKTGKVPDIRFSTNSGDGILPDFAENIDYLTGLEMINSGITSLIDYIDVAYPNQTSDVQSVLDDWLRYWNKQLNYFVKRQEV